MPRHYLDMSGVIVTIEAVHQILDEANNCDEKKCRIRVALGAKNMTALCCLTITGIRCHQRLVAPVCVSFSAAHGCCLIIGV